MKTILPIIVAMFVATVAILPAGVRAEMTGTAERKAAVEERRPATRLVVANLYELSGGQFDITYSTTSITGKPLLSYQDATQTRNFSGDEIHTVQTDFGDVVSVFLERGREGGSTIFSLIVPRVNVAQGGSAHVRTHGIMTRQKLLVPTPRGQETVNTITALNGMASEVQF
jgi:hypothetical protein